LVVDRDLFDVAASLLRRHFASGPGRACAAYSRSGRVLTGVLAAGARGDVEPEYDAMRESAACGELIAALVTVEWNGPGTPIMCRVPPAGILERLHRHARRHAQIAVAASPGQVPACRSLWELARETPPPRNTALQEGNFGAGMKALAQPLMQLAQQKGVPRMRAAFARAVLDALDDVAVRRNAASPAPRGSRFLTPPQLESVGLRHVWLAFERAAEQFVFDLVDDIRPDLARLGCNGADIVHIKQGFEALRNVVAVAVTYAGTGTEVANECPFYPYDARILDAGLPLHEYVRCEPLPPTVAADVARRNEALVRRLITMFSERGEGGFAAYLRQRKLFSVDIFDGGGTGHCPFASVSIELVHAMAVSLSRALDLGVIALEPDSRATP
jgi:hypothetical protein